MRKTFLLSLFHGILLSGAALIAFTGLLRAAAQPSKGTPATVAKPIAIRGALMQERDGKWVAVKPDGDVTAGGVVVSVPKATLVSANGAVELRMEADIGKRGPYPVLESAVRLHDNPKADLDVTLERGIIVLKNAKKEGSAKVRLRFVDAECDIELQTPETAIGMELYSRHPPGLERFLTAEKKEPVTSVVMLVLKGRVVLTSKGESYALEAPPGPAMVHWESVTDHFSMEFKKELPEGIGVLTPEEEKKLDQVCSCAAQLYEKDIGLVLEAFLDSDQELDRLLGVTAAGAVDDLSLVLSALADRDHPELRDHAILVLRHWMGRGPGQVLKLYEALAGSKYYSEIQAKTIVQLLFGFSKEDHFNPATYDLLIAYLNHRQLAIRELARWHLVRLVPEGRDISYDAADHSAERLKAIEQWRKLIPKGKLPQTTKPPKS